MNEFENGQTIDRIIDGGFSSDFSVNLIYLKILFFLDKNHLDSQS